MLTIPWRKKAFNRSVNRRQYPNLPCPLDGAANSTVTWQATQPGLLLERQAMLTSQPANVASESNVQDLACPLSGLHLNFHSFVQICQCLLLYR